MCEKKSLRRLRLLGVVCVAVLMLGNAFAAEVRQWTSVNGQKVTAQLQHPTKAYVPLSDGKKTTKVPYNELSTDDLVWLFKNYPHTEEPITSAMRERIPPLVTALQLQQVGKLRKDLPFLNTFIDATLIERLKDSKLPEINDIAVRFPDMRQSILLVIGERLKNPTDEFFAIGKFSDFGNHNQYVEKKIAAHEEIAAKYPELRKSVVDVINIELADTTKNRFWDDLKLLSNLIASFPETGLAVKEVLLRSIRNPATLEKKQHTVFYDSFGVRFSRDDVTEYLGGWITKTGGHPVRPREMLSIEVFDRARMEAIVTQWAAFKPHLEAAIMQELQNTARRWSWDELRELVVSFPGIQKEAEAVVARDLSSPKPQFEDIDLAEILDSFPDLKDVVAKRIERDLDSPQKDYAPETLIDLVKRYPDIQRRAEARLRRQMEDPVFNRDFENLDRLDKIVQAFPDLKICASTVVARMIAPERSEDASRIGRPDLDLAKKIATRFPDMMKDVEAVFDKALQSTMVKWNHQELAELRMTFPNLEPTAASTLSRDLNSGIKEYTIDELLAFAKQFPSIKDHCSALVLQHVQNPANRIDLKKLMEIAWRFPSVSSELENDIENAVNDLIDNRYYYAYDDWHYGRMIEFLSRLMRDYPDQKERITKVVYRRIERVVEHSDPTSLKEWLLNSELPYDDRVAQALATKQIVMKKPEQPETTTPSSVKDQRELPDPQTPDGATPDPAAQPAGADTAGPAPATTDPSTTPSNDQSDTVGPPITGITGGEDATRRIPGPSDMTWQQYSLSILKTWWREITIGAILITLLLYIRWLLRRFKRWRRRRSEEAASRQADGTSAV